MRKKILLLGKNGQVGWELQRTLAPLGELTSFGSTELNFTNADALRETVLASGADLVVNAAAYTAVDKAESERELAEKINGVAPGVIAAAARDLGAWFVHYSTDYVFDGTKNEPYLETDAPNPVGVYGQSKLRGEKEVQQVSERFVIFRLAWVYGLRGHNFLLTMQRLAREGKNLRVVSDQLGSPSWSRMIAEGSSSVATSLLSGKSATSGIYHLTSGGVTSWHGFASRIVESMPETERRTQSVQPIPTSDYPTPARRPAYSVLDCAKVRDAFGVQLPAWDEALALALNR